MTPTYLKASEGWMCASCQNEVRLLIEVLHVCICIYMCVYIYIYEHVTRGRTFARSAQNSFWDFNLLCSVGECFLQTANMQNIDISIYFLCLLASLRLPKTVPKSAFDACLKDILEQLTKSSTNRHTLKEH